MAVDPDRIAAVAGAMGDAAYLGLLDRLVATLTEVPADVPTLHRLQGSAATLGLSDLAERLLAAELAVAAGQRPDGAGITAALASGVALARAAVTGQRDNTQRGDIQRSDSQRAGTNA